jgi:hypothetical protein
VEAIHQLLQNRHTCICDPPSQSEGRTTLCISPSISFIHRYHVYLSGFSITQGLCCARLDNPSHRVSFQIGLSVFLEVPRHRLSLGRPSPDYYRVPETEGEVHLKCYVEVMASQIRTKLWPLGSNDFLLCSHNFVGRLLIQHNIIQHLC